MYKEVEVVEVHNVRMSELDQRGLGAEVDLKLQNPNRYKIKVTESDLKVWINGREAGKVRLLEPITVLSNSTSNYTLKVHAPYEELAPGFLASLLSLLFTDEIVFKAEGHVKGKALGVIRKVDVSVNTTVPLGER
jgi:LEA14-like dessication related protein